MTIQTVLRMGEPCLLAKASPVVQFNTPELNLLIQDLEDTMHHLNGAGIAAPQIGVSLQVVIFGQKSASAHKNPRYPDADVVPYTVLINPTLTPMGLEVEDGWEGCLSVPSMRGIVPRYTRLHYAGFDQYGNAIDRIVSGFHARVVQHECDHLDGILYPMRIKDLKDFGFTDVFFPNQDIQDD
ncbi:MAG: peptide deformylase [Methylotenera sp.]|nr:peptide deformylase [Methylotenera sp.]